MRFVNPQTGIYFCHTQKVGKTRKQPVRYILAANLSRLMELDQELRTLEQVAKKTKVGRSTIDRIKKATVSPTLDNLEKIALAAGLEPWQLLVDGLDPANPPLLAEVSQKQMELFKRFKDAAKELSDE